MRLAFILRGLQGLSIAFDRPKLLVQGALINVTDSAGLGMSWQIVNCKSTAGRLVAAQVDQLKLSKPYLIGKV